MSTDQPTNPHRGSDFTEFMIEEGLMSLTETIAFIRRYNAWRRGDDSEQPQPYQIGQALDALCDHAERLERELDQERQDRKQADLDAIRALGERNDARKESAVWKHEVDLLRAELEKFDEKAISMFIELHELKQRRP